MSLKDAWKSRLSNLTSNISSSTILNSTKQNLSTVSNFVKQIVTHEDEQRLEASELGIYYITNNILAMDYPSQDTLFTGSRMEKIIHKNETLSKIGTFISNSLAHKISKFLNKYHDERYMIWNLSERSYDTSIFNDNVIEVKFPKYPTPPLEQLFTLCQSIDNWLHTHQQNICVIHCGAGKGRTVTCISAYLSYSQYQNMTPAKAVQYVCNQMNGTIKTLTIPSQTRYLSYLSKILVNKQYPKSNSLVIQNIIIHGIPIFDKQVVQILNKGKKKKNKKKQNDSNDVNVNSNNDKTNNNNENVETNNDQSHLNSTDNNIQPNDNLPNNQNVNDNANLNKTITMGDKNGNDKKENEQTHEHENKIENKIENATNSENKNENKTENKTENNTQNENDNKTENNTQNENKK